MTRKSPEEPDLISEVLHSLDDLGEEGLIFLPALPTQSMIEAGAVAGGIDPAAVQKIYLAMVKADSLPDDTRASLSSVTLN